MSVQPPQTNDVVQNIDLLHVIQDMTFFGVDLKNPFDFIDKQKYFCDYIYYTNAHWAITQLNKWNEFRHFTPENNSFMFSRDELIKVIQVKMWEQTYGDIFSEDLPFTVNPSLTIADSHTGATYGYTLQKMHYIAKNGIEEFKKQYFLIPNN
jgi:hypothetical protein